MSKIITRRERQGGTSGLARFCMRWREGRQSGGITKIYALSKGGSINLMRPNVDRATPASNREVHRRSNNNNSNNMDKYRQKPQRKY